MFKYSIVQTFKSYWPVLLFCLSRFLYPGREADVKADDGGREVQDGKYEHFANINDTVQEEIRKLIVESKLKSNVWDCFVSSKFDENKPSLMTFVSTTNLDSLLFGR